MHSKNFWAQMISKMHSVLNRFCTHICIMHFKNAEKAIIDNANENERGEKNFCNPTKLFALIIFLIRWMSCFCFTAYFYVNGFSFDSIISIVDFDVTVLVRVFDVNALVSHSEKCQSHQSDDMHMTFFAVSGCSQSLQMSKKAANLRLTWSLLL